MAGGEEWEGGGAYFVFDPEGEGFRSFKTVEARDRFAEKAIACYLSEGWNPGVESVVAGVITHGVVETDRVDRPAAADIDEEGFDGEGNDWSQGHEYFCNYRLKANSVLR